MALSIIAYITTVKLCQIMSLPTPEQKDRRSSFEEEMKGKRNRAFLAVKAELAEKEKIKRRLLKQQQKLNRGKKTKINPMDEAVCYVDAQRNMAVTMGERDVKMDVKEKSR